MSLTAHIVQRIDKHLPDDFTGNQRKRISQEIFDPLHAEGIEVLTDVDRAMYGLPPRGPAGWTMEEYQALERKRVEAMYAPMGVTKVFEKNPFK
jgi:hypothetical protein